MVKKMTIEDLAVITANGFNGVDKLIDDVESEMKKGFDRIENLLLCDHLNRIEGLKIPYSS